MTNFAAESKAKASVAGSGGLGFGCMGITAFYGDPMTDEACVELLKTVYDQGCRHFDTAEVYKSGNPFGDAEGDKWNEKQLSKFFKTVPRESFTVATKYFPHKWEKKCDYETVKKSLTLSLERLELEYVDLYYCHRVVDLDGAKAFTAACAKLKEEGLIKNIGISEISGAWLKECHAIAPIAAVQQEWSLITRGLVEEDLAPACAELGVTVVAYSPLGRNLLTGVVTEAPTDWRASNVPRYNPENLEKNKALVAEVEALAAKKGATAAQLSLAWLFHKAKELGVAVLPIPGTTKSKHALSNIQATDISISPDQEHLLEDLASRVAGERGNDSYQAMGIEAQLAAGNL